MHLNSELGLEKDYVAYMNQGLSVDYAVASPSHMSTFSKLATVLDPPMLYRDAGHWSRALSSDVFQPVVDDIYKRADILLLGYGGGGVRHLIVNSSKPLQTVNCRWPLPRTQTPRFAWRHQIPTGSPAGQR